MELVEGLPINQHAEQRSLTTWQRVELVARVCDAVQHAHQKGILHRDLKDSNVLVVSNTGDSTRPAGTRLTDSDSSRSLTTIDEIGQPKVVDFGIARLTDGDPERTEHTYTGQVLGSVASMSPEQLAGDPSSIDVRTDVYAIGVILYKLLTGRPPHDLQGLTIPEAARRVAGSDPPSIESFSRELQGDLSLIAKTALARDMHQRYDSAAAMADDLRRYLINDPILARPPSSVYRVQKFVQRHQLGVALAFAAVLMLVVATGVSTMFGVTAVSALKASDKALYRASISAAAAALRDGDSLLAREFLGNAPAELRGWEWHHYQHALDQSVERGSRQFAVIGTGDFQDGKCWLSSDGSLIHVGSHNPILRESIFETFDAITLESISGWNMPRRERCLGSLDGRASMVMYDSAGPSFVTRDILTGRELSRVPAPEGSPIGAVSYDGVSEDIDHGASWLQTAVSESHPDSHVEYSVGPRAARWARITGRSLEIEDPSIGGRVLQLATLREGGAAGAFSNDGSRFALTTLDRSVRLFDAVSGKSVWSVTEAHRDAPMAVAFSNDGSILATGGQDRLIKLWDASTGLAIGQLTGHDATVFGIVFSPDDRSLFSVDGSSMYRWNVRDAKDANIVARHPGYVKFLRPSPDGTVIAAMIEPARSMEHDPEQVALHFLETQTTVKPTISRPSGSSIDEMMVLSDDLLIVRSYHRTATGHATTVHAVDTRSGTHREIVHTDTWLRGSFLIHQQSLIVGIDRGERKSISLSRIEPQHEEVVAHGSSRLPRTQDGLQLRDSGYLYRQIGETLWLEHLSTVDPTRALAFAVDADSRILKIDTSTGEQLDSTAPLQTSINALAMLPDGSRLFGAGADTTIRVWDTSDLSLVAVLRGHRDNVTDLLVERDGLSLYSSSDDYTIREWVTGGVTDKQ